ncbi:hypothetical protein V490_04099 [Pseudogymnoascus sp. VKM F-3557]|nr:hypothetical protein V490_04099 [Pseudogymnoascus sp. VKM F-3557]
MQLTTMLLGAVVAAGIIAAPAPAPADAKSMMANVAQWTIEGMVRTCNAADTSCKWSFNIATHTANPTPCQYTVTGKPASHASTNGVHCGGFTISSGWSGQFGPGNGFTTLAVVDNAKKLIVWPAYTDKQLANGVVVTPNQSYAPVTLG